MPPSSRNCKPQLANLVFTQYAEFTQLDKPAALSQHIQALGHELARQAVQDAIDAPAGVMEVVLGPGWPGVMLHEAVGHGLEADFNRKKTSAFSGLIGQRVASERNLTESYLLHHSRM